jgi:hypothetical protein
MAFARQLDFFEKDDPVETLQRDFQLLNKKCLNVQRGLFARFSTLEEEVTFLRDLCQKMKIHLDSLGISGESKVEIIEFPKS